MYKRQDPDNLHRKDRAGVAGNSGYAGHRKGRQELSYIEHTVCQGHIGLHGTLVGYHGNLGQIAGEKQVPADAVYEGGKVNHYGVAGVQQSGPRHYHKQIEHCEGIVLELRCV